MDEERVDAWLDECDERERERREEGEEELITMTMTGTDGTTKGPLPKERAGAGA